MNGRQMLVAVVMMGTLGLVGCNNNKKTSGQNPPPIDGYSQPIPPAPEPVIISEPMSMQPAVAPAPMPQQPMGGQSYTVQKGDTLMSIARKHYSSASKYRDIAAANGITDSNKIKVGQVLILP